MAGETRLSFLVDLNAKEATAAAKALKSEVDKLGAGARQAGDGAGRARDGLGRFTKGAQEAAAAATEFAGAADTAAEGATRFGGALPAVIPHTTKFAAETAKASQSAGMMAAQWNDVIMMTLAGQSPMQLAIQQGTQMTQAFGNAGAGGALRMLGAGFMSMLNPMNLAVIAAIGLGSALVQAFMEAGEAQKSARETLDEYAEGLSALEENIAAVKGLQIEYANAIRSGNAVVLDALSKEAEARLALMELDKIDLAEKQKALAAQMAMDEAAYASSEAQVAARREQIARIQAADKAGTYELSGRIAAQDLATLEPILAAETAEMEAQGNALKRITAERTVIESKIVATNAAELVARQTLSQIEDGTLAVTTGMSNATGQAEAFASGLSRASGILSTIASKIDGLSLDRIAKSAQLAALQAGASPDAARIAGDVASLRHQLQPLLGAPTGAAEYARSQLSELEGNASAVAGLDAQIAAILKDRTEKTGGGGTKQKTDAMAELIGKYRDEIEVLKALDPIQKILAQNHEALAGATEGERANLVQLIAEKTRLEQIQTKLQSIGQLGKNAFTGLATGALTFRSALGNVLDGLAQMAASAAWDLLWSGGGKKGAGLGGWIGSLLGLADGGPVTGRGGPREDNILIRASAGEYMVNAAATARNYPLVEAINAGASPRQLAAVLGSMMPHAPAFATGGRIGGAAPASWQRVMAETRGGSREMALTVNVEGARGNAEIMEMVERGVRGGIETFSRSGLPVRVRQINADPRRVS